jgi:hypothetical protein
MAMEGGWLVPFMADPQQGGQDVKYTAIPLPIPEAASKPPGSSPMHSLAARTHSIRRQQRQQCCS